MALIALLDGPDGTLDEGPEAPCGPHTFVRAPSDGAFLRLIRERPVSVGVVDLSVLDKSPSGPTVLDRLREDFPRLPIVVAIGAHPDPTLLLQLGRFGRCPVLGPGDLRCPATVDRLIRNQLARGPQRIPARLGGTAPTWSLSVLRRAIDAIDRCWSTDELAEQVGMRRQDLSLRLKEVGLPTAGRLLTWVRVFYAAWWLSDPGRSGVSVARQLEYSSSQALVRVVRNLLRVTPGELVARGGLDWAWLKFLQGHPRLVRRAGAWSPSPVVWPVGAGAQPADVPVSRHASPLRPAAEPLYSDRAERTPARIA